MDTYEQLIIYARKIAEHRGYDNLVNGLQPIEALEAKYQAEWREFREKIAKEASLEERLHEAADVLYYACQLEEQSGQPLAGVVLNSLMLLSLTQEQIEAAALAKYRWRSSGAGNKAEAYELQLIKAAIIDLPRTMGRRKQYVEEVQCNIRTLTRHAVEYIDAGRGRRSRRAYLEQIIVDHEYFSQAGEIAKKST